jgi:hypothetical protein
VRQQEAAAQAAQQDARELSQRLADAAAQHEQLQSELHQARDSAAHLQVPPCHRKLPLRVRPSMGIAGGSLAVMDRREAMHTSLPSKRENLT